MSAYHCSQIAASEPPKFGAGRAAGLWARLRDLESSVPDAAPRSNVRLGDHPGTTPLLGGSLLSRSRSDSRWRSGLSRMKAMRRLTRLGGWRQAFFRWNFPIVSRQLGMHSGGGSV